MVFCLIKKLSLFFTQLSNLISWCGLFTALSTDVCTLVSYFRCSLLCFCEMEHRKNTNPYFFIQVPKVQQNEWKMNAGVSEY